MEIKTRYDIGQLVYLTTDPVQEDRLITAIKIVAGGSVIYTLAAGVVETCHYEIELTAHKNVIKSLGLSEN
jgi:hypothetical protein